MLHFNDLKEKIIKLILESSNQDCIYYIIRDVFGRFSIYINGNVEIENTRNLLIQTVGDEWINTVGLIHSNDMIYQTIVNTTELVKDNVFYVERSLVKKAWRYNNANNKKNNINSKVVTFYSYKGGLGRTTTLILTALQIVRQGKKVIVIDFDLEAPGISSILQPESEDFYPKYGTIDFIIESANYRDLSKIDIDEYIYPITSKRLTGLTGGELYVMQATRTTSADTDIDNYFEKLSRIDFSTPIFEDKNNPVQFLLEKVDSRYNPDFIFIDARAGIHDIGGLTLNRYTDEAVCVFYGNKQNMFGLNFILPKIIERNIPFYLINTPVPLSEEEAEEEKNYYLKNSYEVLIKSGYYDEDLVPDIYDESADHYPLNIRYNIDVALLNSELRIDNLLKNEESNNVYYILAETLKSDFQDNKIDTKNGYDKEQILLSIRNIIPGETAAAENEFKTLDDLKRRFYPLKEHKYIFDHNKFLIIGPKGSGKTALFSVLKHPDYAKALAKYVNAPMQNLIKTEWITGLGLGREFPGKDNFDTIGKIDKIEFYRKYWQCLIVKVLQEQIKKNIINISNVVNDIFVCKYSDLKNIIDKNDNISEIVSDLLNELDLVIKNENRVLIITYDALDFALNRSYRGKMIAALIDLWFENMSRFTNLKSKIFLREDIFKFEVKEGITDKVKLNNYTANLGWSYDHLLAMVWKRVIEYNENSAEFIKKILNSNGLSISEDDSIIGYVPMPYEEYNKLILKNIIGEKMGKGNKAYTYNWILYRLADTNQNIVPRSILKLFTISSKNEIEESGKISNDENPIRPKSLENSLKEVSIDRLYDISEEYPEYKKIFDDIKNYCQSFPADEENLWEAIINCGVEKSNVKTVIDELKEIGILKEYQRKKSDPIRYHIPDIYLKGMGLTRKGYK